MSNIASTADDQDSVLLMSTHNFNFRQIDNALPQRLTFYYLQGTSPGPNGRGAQAFQAHVPNGTEVHRFHSFSISRFTGHTRMLGPSVFPDSQVLKMLGPSVFPDSRVEKPSFETQH